MNFSILKLSPSTYGSQLHWFAQRCTVYKFKSEFEILLRNPINMFINVHHQTIKTPSPKKNKQRCNNTKPSPTHHQNITAPSTHITEISPKHTRDITNTSKHLKHHPTTYEPQLHWFAHRCAIYNFKLEFEILLRNPIKMFINIHHQTIKTPSPKKKKHCDINETTPSHHPLIIINITEPSPHIMETSPRHDRDITKTTPRHHRHKTKTRPRQDRDTTETSWVKFFPVHARRPAALSM